MKMPIPWFDKPINSSSTLSERLASDCRNVNKVMTNFISIVRTLSILLGCVFIGLILDSRITYGTLGLIFFMIIGGALLMYFKVDSNEKSFDAYKES